MLSLMLSFFSSNFPETSIGRDGSRKSSRKDSASIPTNSKGGAAATRRHQQGGGDAGNTDPAPELQHPAAACGVHRIGILRGRRA
jgi:hypothetical protein